MATREHKSGDDEEPTSVEDNVLHAQWTGDETAMQLQEYEDGLLFIDDQSGTSENAKTIDLPTETSTVVPSDATPKLQRTPKIESTAMSMKFVKELLVKDHKIENRAAEAAVISQGCDIEPCLHWIERNSFNFMLLEERSKEFEYSCGIITEVEMMEWTVQHLMNYYKVSEGVAKATVIVKGTKNLGECKRYAKIPNDPEIIAISEPLKDYQEKIDLLKGKQPSEKLKTSEKILDPYKEESLSNLSELYGLQEWQATVLLNMLVLLEFDTCFKWVLQHQYDDKKLQEMQRIFAEFNFKHHIVQKLERSQCPDDHRKVAAEVTAVFHSDKWMHGFPGNFPEHVLAICEEITSSVSHVGDTSVAGLLKRYSNNESLVHKQRAVICLCEFMSEVTAKAAVQAAGTSVYNCRRWAEENKDGNGNLQLLYDEELKKYNTVCDLMDFLIKEASLDAGFLDVEKTEWKRREATPGFRLLYQYSYCCSLVESSLRETSSTDFVVCHKWIMARLPASINTINTLVFCMKTVLEPKLNREEIQDRSSRPYTSRSHQLLTLIDEKEWHQARQRYDREFRFDVTKTSRWEYVRLLATAAIQATSSTEFDVCCKWITENAANVGEVTHLARRYQEEMNYEEGFAGRYRMSAVHRWRGPRANVWHASPEFAGGADKVTRKVPSPLERLTIRQLVFCLERVLKKKTNRSRRSHGNRQYSHRHQSFSRLVMTIQEGEWKGAVLEYDPEYSFDVTKKFNLKKYEMLAKAAIQATSSTNFDVCRKWISANADNGYNVESLALQFYQQRGLPSSHSYLSRNTFLRISKLTAETTQKIGLTGGEINLQECSILFPEGALKEEKEFNVTLDNDPKKFPKSSIPITSILGCRPSMEFEKPVTVKMRTCYSAIGDAEITAALYQRKDERDKWTEIQKVTLTSRNEVQFDIMHFSDDVVGVSENASGQGEYHLINDVYIKKDTATIASIFFVNQGAHDLATKDMQSRGVVPMLMKPKEIIVKMGTEIRTDMQCRRPNGAVIIKPNTLSLTVTSDFLKKRGHEIYYELDSLPDNFTGSISIRYTLSVEGQVEETLPLATHWPIVLPEPQVLQQIEHLSIGARTNIRGNIVSAGQARTTLESHDAVYHMGTGSNSP